jgi:hypothetical protein
VTQQDFINFAQIGINIGMFLYIKMLWRRINKIEESYEKRADGVE